MDVEPEVGHEPDTLDREPLRGLVGPTAAGKSALALEVALRAGAEILSLDSMAVYRGLDIGTAKASAAERARVPHHLIDLVEPWERYDVARWLEDARRALEDIRARGRRALFVGGTGFYLAALLRGLYRGPSADLELRGELELRWSELGPEAFHAELARVDPESAARLHPNDKKRVVRALEIQRQTGRPWSELRREWSRSASERELRARLVGLQLMPGELDQRILARTRRMLREGWREEALRLRAGPASDTALQALGYAEVLRWADGEWNEEDAVRQIALRTRQFARRQLTWYRKLPIHWLRAPETSAELEDATRTALAVFGW